MCNGELMGKDHTLEFVYMTRWRVKVCEKLIIIIIIIIIILVNFKKIIISFIAPYNNIRQFDLLKSSKYSLLQDYS